jgi:hypothetical protein
VRTGLRRASLRRVRTGVRLRGGRRPLRAGPVAHLRDPCRASALLDKQARAVNDDRSDGSGSGRPAHADPQAIRPAPRRQLPFRAAAARLLGCGGERRSHRGHDRTSGKPAAALSSKRLGRLSNARAPGRLQPAHLAITACEAGKRPLRLRPAPGACPNGLRAFQACLLRPNQTFRANCRRVARYKVSSTALSGFDILPSYLIASVDR